MVPSPWQSGGPITLASDTDSQRAAHLQPFAKIGLNTATGIGTNLVARDLTGRPLAGAIMFSSSSTSLLYRLTVGSYTGSSSVVRYALNAFVIRAAIERGTQVLVQDGTYLVTPKGIRCLAENSGYEPRRIIVTEPDLYRRHPIRQDCGTVAATANAHAPQPPRERTHST